MCEPMVFIIILNYKSTQDAIELFMELQIQNYNNFEIMVIDNNSPDNSKEILKKRIPIENLILNNKNLGYAGGNNIGIRKAIEEGADYVWVLNPDIRVEKDTLKTLINIISNDNQIAAIGPRICYRIDKEKIFSDGGIIDFKSGIATGHKNNGLNRKQVNQNCINTVDYVNGSCFLLNLKTLADIGYIREDFFLYFEETEWCIRAKRHGWKLAVTTETNAFHLTSNHGVFFYFYMSRNRIWLAKIINQFFWNTLLSELKELQDLLMKVMYCFIHRKKDYLFRYFFAKCLGLFFGVVIFKRGVEK
ncbi:MAG: glycosyltransferase family 2 protein [Candidatus Delongbacteria bacterium]|nr:glycosyltransferase family 2 protein [Candidatus Delongbacteria bacterium]